MKAHMSKLFALPVIALFLATPAYSADKTQATTKPTKFLEHADVEKIVERGNPSDALEILAPLTGRWDYKAAMWAVAGAEPDWTTGKMSSRMILGNRFLSSELNGSYNVGGQDIPVNGQGLIGYDAVKKSFSTSWVDTLNTGMMTGSAKYDEKKKVLTETGKFINPLTAAEESYRTEVGFTDSESYKRTIFATGKNGKERKFMEIEYSRSGSFTPPAAEEQKPPQ